MLGVCIPKKGGNKPYGHIQKHLEEVFSLRGEYLIIDDTPPETQVIVVNFISTRELFIKADTMSTAEDLEPFALQLAEAFNTFAYLRDRSDFQEGQETCVYRFNFSSKAVNVVGKDYIFDEWNKQFKEAFGELGFKRKRRQYYFRVVNDQVFQIINLQKCSYPGSYTINYDIKSITDKWFLQMDGDVYPSHRLGELLDNRCDYWWDYTKNDYQSVMQDTISKIKDHVIPLFNQKTRLSSTSTTVEQWLLAEPDTVESSLAQGLDIIKRKYMKCRVFID